MDTQLIKMTMDYMPQQTPDVDPVSVECWAPVYDIGSTFNQHSLSISCSLGQDDMLQKMIQATKCEYLMDDIEMP